MKNIFKMLFNIGKAEVAKAVITTGKTISNYGKEKKNWIVLIGVPLIVVEILCFGLFLNHKIKEMNQPGYVSAVDEYRANDLLIALMRNNDPEMPHCECDCVFWEMAGVNKYTGDQMYACGNCKNFFEMVYAGNSQFEKLTFIDVDEWKERKGW